MKKTIIILSILGLLLTIASCSKFLEVTPTFIFPEETALKTLDGAQSTTMGAFNILQSNSLYGGGIIANSELLADFVSTEAISDFGLNQLRTHQINTLNSITGNIWADAYHAIHTSNLILKHLPDYGNKDLIRVNQIKGQCLFIRAAMHLELVKLFAQPSGFTGDDSHLGVPIRLTPGSATVGGTTPRSTVAQVYAQVIADLQQAEQLLPLDAYYVGDSMLFASRYTAQAFLMRAYFLQHKYQDAKDYCDKIVNASRFALDSPNIKQAFSLSGTNQDKEIVFSIVNLATDNVNGSLNGRFKVAQFGSLLPTYRMSNLFVAYQTNKADLRVSSFYGVRAGKVICKKYDASVMNVPVIRYAEVLLTRAECKAQLAQDDASVREDVNTVRRRAGVPQDNSTTGKTALLNLVRGERDFELGMEGDRLFELKRRQGLFRTQAGDFSWNDPTMIFPIPQQEVDQNKNMVQNPGY
jgi:starch-binding outer membrane protein, SusD/RagB family